MVHPLILQLGLILLKIVCLLVAIAYYTIAERKIMAAIQRRRGPNVVGFWGLLQPLADGLKLIAKEMVIPSHSNSRIFVIAPLTILTLGLLSWSILPFGCFDYSESTQLNVSSVGSFGASNTGSSFFSVIEANDISDVRYGLLVILALSSLTVYGLIIAGWASNSKYAFLGALRSAAQMISYEVSISLVLIPVIFMSGSLNFTEIVCAQAATVMYVFPLLPLAIIFFISMIAETNRTPFDLPEAEAELVAGYNVEYSSIIFAMFFLAEYGNMIMMSLINTELFYGGWYGPAFLPSSTIVALKALVFCFAFVLVRATFPRYRYDQLMDIGWKIFLPVSTGLLLFVIGVIMAFDGVPEVSEIALASLAASQVKSAPCSNRTFLPLVIFMAVVCYFYTTIGVVHCGAAVLSPSELLDLVEKIHSNIEIFRSNLTTSEQKKACMDFFNSVRQEYSPAQLKQLAVTLYEKYAQIMPTPFVEPMVLTTQSKILIAGAIIFYICKTIFGA